MKVFRLFIGPSVAVTRRRAGVKQKERDTVRSAGDWRPRGRRSRSDGGLVPAPPPTGPCPPLTDSLDDPAIRLRRTSYSPSGWNLAVPAAGVNLRARPGLRGLPVPHVDPARLQPLACGPRARCTS